MRLKKLDESLYFNKYTAERKAQIKKVLEKSAKKLNMHLDRYGDWNLNVETPRHKRLVFTLSDSGWANFYSVDKYGREGGIDYVWSNKWEKVLASVSNYDEDAEYLFYSLETIEATPRAFDKMVQCTISG